MNYFKNNILFNTVQLDVNFLILRIFIYFV